MMERYDKLYSELKLLIEMKKEFVDDEEMLQYIQFKMNKIETELSYIEKAWLNDEI
jgi:hypothetical protein